MILLGLALFSLNYSCDERIVRLNDIQLIGSHNSYKISIEQPLWEYIYQQEPKEAIALQYGHIPIIEQLEMGLRALEFDVFHDPEGGYYSNPMGLAVLKEMGMPTQEFDSEGKLNEPGLKMFHVQDIDFRSHHLLFKDCLKTLKRWSDENPDHTPVFITMNTNDSKIASLKDPLPFTASALNRIDVEIRSVLSVNKLITPGLVRGNFKTLEQAVLTRGWPKLEDVKGRFLFVLNASSDKISRYLQGHPSKEGRVLFTDSEEGNPEAAFRVVNDPIKNFDYIKDLVNKGYMVRTRADADTKEARNNDFTRFEKAKASGAHIISTDYYLPSTHFESTYQVRFDNHGFVRIRD